MIQPEGKGFSDREIVPRPKKVAVRTVGRTRELGVRLSASEAVQRNEARRRDVYENPKAVYAPESNAVLPPEGEAREALVARIRECKQAGMSNVTTAAALELEVHQVAMLCRKHQIKKSAEEK